MFQNADFKVVSPSDDLKALAQKFDVVLESHRFLYEFLVLSKDMAHNACR